MRKQINAIIEGLNESRDIEYKVSKELVENTKKVYKKLLSILDADKVGDVDSAIELVKKAFKEVNGKVSIRSKTQTYFAYSGSVGKFTIGGSVSLKDYTDADFNILAEDLTAGYWKNNGGESHYTPDLIRFLKGKNTINGSNFVVESVSTKGYKIEIKNTWGEPLCLAKTKEQALSIKKALEKEYGGEFSINESLDMENVTSKFMKHIKKYSLSANDKMMVQEIINRVEGSLKEVSPEFSIKKIESNSERGSGDDSGSEPGSPEVASNTDEITVLIRLEDSIKPNEEAKKMLKNLKDLKSKFEDISLEVGEISDISKYKSDVNLVVYLSSDGDYTSNTLVIGYARNQIFITLECCTPLV